MVQRVGEVPWGQRKILDENLDQTFENLPIEIVKMKNTTVRDENVPFFAEFDG